jgi:DNA-binding PadR family transcriptional regulator
MTIKELILEKISEVGEGMLDAFFPAKYPEARIWRNLLGLDDDYKFFRKNFSRSLSSLAADGFIKRRGSKRQAVWRITEEGKEYLRRNLEKADYKNEDGRTRIVVFDIPESERQKRRWLRGRLLELNYKPLPKQFIDDLGDFKLWRYIFIFDINGEVRPSGYK